MITEALSNLYEKIRRIFARYSVNITLDQEIQQSFLNKKFKKRKKLYKSITQYPKLLEELEYHNIQEQIFQLDQQHKIEGMKNYSNILCKLAKIFLDKYDLYKQQNSLLDYDDLIYLTQNLLTDNHAKDWVMRKLDGGIDHLLVDEAQDTSPEQWNIINAIIAELYLSTKEQKTVFVVGDEKQSIFSFQGANLSSFDHFNQSLSNKLSNANRDFKNITLEWSYRSTKEIIDIVYLIFEQIKNTTPQLFTSENFKILPFRDSHKGRVEIWPLIIGEKDQRQFWSLPQEQNNYQSTQQLLAQQIASFIKNQIVSKRILHATNLPVKEADFMILVRKRDELVFEIINCLKNSGLQIEDIDRVTLDKSLSVLDLISVGKFVLLPQDDLNLASLLKSPIIGMSEEQLQSLAISRGKNSIWVYLSNLPEYRTLYEKLCYFLQIYKISNCGNFFLLIADCLDIRKILLACNGSDSNDLINELIYLSSNYSNNVDSSLQSFIYWFENNSIEIKRNFESSNKIRVMTVHASKGLQAPIVILCDTTSLPTNKNKFIWTEEGEIFSIIQSSNSPEFFKDLKEQEQQKELQEYIRLLYVAMTRAEDHLVICGHHSSNKLPENCWYELISRTLSLHGKQGEDNIIIYQTNDEKINQLININSTETIMQSCGNKTIDWFFDEGLISKITCSSKKNYASLSPLIPNNYLEYGKIFHKILEDVSRINNFSLLKDHPLIKKLPIELQGKIQNNIIKLLNNKEFMALEGQELIAEMPLGTNLRGEVKIGRVDLVAINKDQITIIDYKSDASPPQNTLLVKEFYIDQINFYRHIMQKIYPHSKIICKILWLENSCFMVID